MTATWPIRDHAFKLEPIFRLIISCKQKDFLGRLLGRSALDSIHQNHLGLTETEIEFRINYYSWPMILPRETENIRWPLNDILYIPVKITKHEIDVTDRQLWVQFDLPWICCFTDASLDKLYRCSRKNIIYFYVLVVSIKTLWKMYTRVLFLVDSDLWWFWWMSSIGIHQNHLFSLRYKSAFSPQAHLYFQGLLSY